ncbi:hypothetical protein COOONC_20903 [Cooperia oncophora]
MCNCSSHVAGALLEQFVKAYLGITFAELKSNAQVQPCYTPSKCAQQWSRLGFKHLREEFLRYRANSLDSKAIFLTEGQIFNVLTLPYSYIAALQPALEKEWREVPLEDREEYRRKFCAFRILDENSSIKYTVKT